MSQWTADRPVMARWISFFCCWVLLTFTNASNLPLLSGTLRTFQVYACDGDDLRIDCYTNTVISINLAQYGRQVPSSQLCPPKGGEAVLNDTTDCLASEALRTVEAECREQQACRIATSPESFGGDPCPGVRKYAEVAYKCRPNTFVNKIVCEGDRLRLKCHRPTRIVIYSATFGGMHYDIAECPQPEGVKGQDCLVSYATETVMSSCHGKRKCSIGADVGTFGNPSCPKGVRLFLKVVYTCVPKEILKDLDLGGGEGDGKDQVEESDYPGFVDENQMALPPSPAIPKWNGDIEAKRTTQTKDLGPKDMVKTTQKTDMQSDENTDEEMLESNCTEEQRIIGFLTEWINAYKFVKDNKEKFILYLTVSLGAGLVAFLVVLAVRLYLQKRRERKRSKMNISDPIPSALDDDLSDMDQYDPSSRPETSIEVVRYANRSTMRRQDSDTNPRAPMRSMNSYYYS